MVAADAEIREGIVELGVPFFTTALGLYGDDGLPGLSGSASLTVAGLVGNALTSAGCSSLFSDALCSMGDGVSVTSTLVVCILGIRTMLIS